MRKEAILFSVLMILLCGGGVVFAQHSAMFRTITTIPPSAQAGKEIVFVVEITNTGTETWVSAEYSPLSQVSVPVLVILTTKIIPLPA